MEHRLSQQIEKVAVRYRRLRFWSSLAVVWLFTAACGVGFLALNRLAEWNLPSPIGLLCGLAAVAAIAAIWLASRSAHDYRWVAERIEAAHPELKSCLLAAIEQRPNVPGGRFGFLQDRVIRQALNHAYGHAWPRVVPTRRFVVALFGNVAGALLLLFVLAGLSSQSAARRAEAATAISSAPRLPAGLLSVTIEPGNTEVERGTSLLVLARFQGSEPAEATLVYQPEDGLPRPPSESDDGLEKPTSADARPDAVSLAMAKSLDDPVFGGRIPVVEQPLDYHVALADFTSETFHVGVFEYPKLVQADARLTYPEYTGLDERLVQDVRTVSVVEGTRLTLLCRLNKPVASATLVEEGAEPLALVAAEDDPKIRQVTLTCDKSHRFRLQLVDDAGRKNKNPVELTIKVLPNKPPDLKLAFPAHDVEVSPLEETEVKATAWDDYGLARFGLTYELAGGERRELTLGEKAAGKERREMAHVIRFEDLKAEPDQLLSYHFWAEDAGPDGKPRRTESDMYFAEVRPFEEIFRQGQQPPGGSQQTQQQGAENAQAAEKLAQLQKDIINATWKLIRRELPAEPSNAFSGDVRTIQESQASAKEQAESLAEKLQDPQSKAHATEVMRATQEAIDQLQQAHDGPAVEPMRPALAAEQSAYQALLKLRAREHSVIRSQRQRGGGGAGGSNRSQQQLNELELKNDDNRYETQRTAQSPQNAEQRETRQVLNRLSELARRQNDLNERLKELQSALEEAKTEPEREEIRRQLKRLREEEEEILRDTDELKARMDQPENQERMAESRQQLDQTRDQVRRASEALEQEMVTQAAAAGTRAQRDFEELKNEFRRRASGQFTDQMRDMREDARQLDEKEKEIGERLAGQDNRDAPAKSLRDADKRAEIPGELAEQKERLADLVNRMRETIEEAEATEPLLAEQLYDTARKTQERNLERALEAAELSMRRGLTDDARGQERIASKGIGELRQGIERAAESVLGDDTEALRRAREELDRLADQIGDEVARNTEEGFRGSAAADVPQGSGFRDDEQDGQRSPHAPREGRLSPQGDGQPMSERGQRDSEQSEQSNPAQPNERPSASQQPGEGQQSPRNAGGERPQDAERSSNERPSARSREPGSQQTPQGNQPGGQAGGSDQNSQNRQGRPQPGLRGGERNQQGGSQVGPGGFAPFFESGNRAWAPLAGEDFRDWSDRLRDVEEMIDDPELRAEAARIRERARGIRAELKRHSKEPNWDLVKVDVSRPLYELRDRVAEELLRRTSKDSLLPLDRDPVPPKYTEKTRRYYERLGSGR